MRYQSEEAKTGRVTKEAATKMKKSESNRTRGIALSRLLTAFILSFGVFSMQSAYAAAIVVNDLLSLSAVCGS